MNKISEILNKDNILKPEKMLKCRYCGKPYVWFDKDIKFKKIHVQVPDCDCIEKIERQREQAALAERKREKQKQLFENSMMAPFFQEKTFSALKKSEHYDFCKNYAANFNLNNSKGMRLTGGVGTGKTTLLAAICNDLMKQGYTCLFTTFSELLDKFGTFSYEHAGDITPLLNWLVSFDFVVLDDLGRENYTERRKEIAFRIIDKLLNYKIITAFTANPEMLQRLQKMPEWKAILDRLKDTCPILLQFKSNSMRGQECLK